MNISDHLLYSPAFPFHQVLHASLERKQKHMEKCDYIDPKHISHFQLNAHSQTNNNNNNTHIIFWKQTKAHGKGLKTAIIFAGLFQQKKGFIKRAVDGNLYTRYLVVKVIV